MTAIFCVAESSAAEVTLTAERVEGLGFAARGVRARLDPDGTGKLDIEIENLDVQGRTWRRSRLACAPILNRGTRIGCEKGVLDLGVSIPLRLSFDTGTSFLDAEFLPAPNERWRVAGGPAKQGWKGRVEVEGGDAMRFAPLIPAPAPKLTGGRVSGGLDIAVADSGEVTADGGFRFAGVGFSDPSGLHAAEKLAGVVKVRTEGRRGEIHYRASLDWTEGELFWQPLYLKAGHSLEAEGTLDAARISVDAGKARLKSVGNIAFSANWDLRRNTLVSSVGGAAALDIAGLYAEIAKPFLESTAASDLRAGGKADFGWRYADEALQAFYVNLHRSSFEDRAGRYALSGLDAAIPWDRVNATGAQVTLESAELLRLPIGRVELPVELQGYYARTPKLEVPLLDGKVQVEDFVARRPQDAWTWQFTGGITPISVAELTRTLGLPVMLGRFSAVIPKVWYEASTMRVDGALLFKVFDGTVVVTNLSLVEPLGRAPRLYADVDMRNLDLDLVTRTFSFGSITGRIDASVKGLELANWKLVKFDAKVESSPGSYPKRISQAAVQNISALGGAGAAAAIQRTALRFFERFGYSKLGWSCRLRNGVCEMGGVEPAAQGYVIVEGGGIPAISVLGYNRAVDWEELVARLKRVTREGADPVVR